MDFKNKDLENKFHHLWTKAIGATDYNKEEWMCVEKELLQIINQNKECQKENKELKRRARG